MTKRKFSKLLNKETTYTATKDRFDKVIGRILLKDIKYNGKVYADHVWVREESVLNRIIKETKISFKGTAYMYNDKFGIRKQGLKHCHDYTKLNEDYTQEDSKENLKQMRKRKDQG